MEREVEVEEVEVVVVEVAAAAERTPRLEALRSHPPQMNCPRASISSSSSRS